jgi:hypothetical protein
MVVAPDTYVFVDENNAEYDYRKRVLPSFLPGPEFRKLYKKANVAQYARTKGLAPAVSRTISTGGEQCTESDLDSLAEEFELRTSDEIPTSGGEAEE